MYMYISHFFHRFSLRKAEKKLVLKDITLNKRNSKLYIYIWNQNGVAKRNYSQEYIRLDFAWNNDLKDELSGGIPQNRYPYESEKLRRTNSK